jgi:hypothetical protein
MAKPKEWAEPRDNAADRRGPADDLGHYAQVAVPVRRPQPGRADRPAPGLGAWAFARSALVNGDTDPIAAGLLIDLKTSAKKTSLVR